MDLTFLWQEGLILGIGAALKWLVDVVRRRRRQAPLRRLLGGGALREDGLVVHVSQFDPLCEDDFDRTATTTWMRKVAPLATVRTSINAKESGHDGDTVPIYSKVLLVEEFEAFTEIEAMFTEFGARTKIRLADAAASIGHLDERSSIISLGLSPSALEFLSTPAVSDLRVEQRGPTLDSWRLQLDGADGGTRTFTVSDRAGIGCVMRLPHPVHADLGILLVFGDRVETTLAMTRWLRANLRQLMSGGGRTSRLLVVAEISGPGWTERQVVHRVRDGVVELERTGRLEASRA